MSIHWTRSAIPNETENQEYTPRYLVIIDAILTNLLYPARFVVNG